MAYVPLHKRKEMYQKDIVYGDDPSRLKCTIKNSSETAEIKVYPDFIKVHSMRSNEGKDVRLTLKDLRKIKECILS